MSDPPLRGDIWDAELTPTRGHEQSSFRPVLIVSSDRLNASPAELAIVLPLTRRQRGIPTHVPVTPPEGGLADISLILCEQVRAVSLQRLGRRRGRVAAGTMEQVENHLKILLDLW
jgi:mRNA interferase MazF